MNLSKPYPHYCSTHNVYYGSPTDTIPATMCPICGIAKELRSQPAPRTYEVSRALSWVDAVEQAAPNALCRPQQSAEPVISEGWMRDRGKVEDLLVHLESMAWQLDSKGDPDCVDQGQAMAAEVVRQVLIPMLDRAASPGPSELVEEMEKLAAEWELRYGPTYGQKTHARADDLRALITRHRGKS